MSSQELYGLPTAGLSDKDCSHDHVDGRNGAKGGNWDKDGNGNGSVKEGYKNWILTNEDTIKTLFPLVTHV